MDDRDNEVPEPRRIEITGEADCLRVFAMTKANMCARKAGPDLHSE